jgi:tryptophan-rich sensory protein
MINNEYADNKEQEIHKCMFLFVVHKLLNKKWNRVFIYFLNTKDIWIEVQIVEHL